jgi:hypothetical protein
VRCHAPVPSSPSAVVRCLQPSHRPGLIRPILLILGAIVVATALGGGAGCGPQAKPPLTAAPVAAAPGLPAPSAQAWRVPVEVKRWAGAGVETLGSYPSALSQLAAGEAWFVEPTTLLGAAELAELLADVVASRVPGLSLRSQVLDPGWSAALAKAEDLRALELSDTALSDADLLAAPLPGLRRIYLAGTAITDRAAAFWSAHAALEVVDLSDTAIGDATMQALSAARGLRALAVAGTHLTDSSAEALGSMAKLDVLDLARTRVGKLTASAVAGLPLRELYLSETDAAAAAHQLAPLAATLVRLDLSASAVGPAQLAWLAAARSLRALLLGDTKIDDTTVHAIAQLTGLEELDLAGTSASAAALTAVAALPALVDLDVADTLAGDATALALLAKPRLRRLRLDGTAISDAGMRAAPAGLRELYASRTTLSDVGVAKLGPLRELAALGLADTAIGDPSAIRIAALPVLRTLVIDGVRWTRSGFAALGALTGLERLFMERTALDDEAFAALGDLRELRALHVHDTDLTDAGLAVARAFTQLEELTLGDCPLTQPVDALAAWPRLRSLSLYGLPVSDGALPKLTSHRWLQVLNLGATEVTDVTALAALAQLRSLGLTETRVTARGIAALANAAHLTDLSLAGTPVDAAAAPTLAQIQGLRRLDVRGTPLAAPPTSGADPLLPLVRRGVLIKRAPQD